MKIFIAQPMKGKSESEILAERDRLIALAQKECGEDVEILDTYFTDYSGEPLGYIGKSIMVLADADAAIFGEGWEDFRGCRIEFICCKEYGIKIIAS